jgi:hypothetical protein
MPLCLWDIAQRSAGRHKGCDERGHDLDTVWMASFDATQPAQAAPPPSARKIMAIFTLSDAARLGGG